MNLPTVHHVSFNNFILQSLSNRLVFIPRKLYLFSGAYPFFQVGQSIVSESLLLIMSAPIASLGPH